MFSQHIQEGTLALAILVLLVLVVNPGHIWMPDMLAMTLAALLLLVVCWFGVFVWNERAADEREHLHKLLASRAAFLIGAGILAVGLLVQSLSHSVDPWLAFSLGAMVITKVVRIRFVRKQQ